MVALVALVAGAACSGHDDAAPVSSTTRASSTTTTVAPSLSERTGEISFPAARTVEVRGATLAPGEAIGFGFHPNGTVTRVRASDPAVELCPATTDGAVDTTGGSWPGGVFASCVPLEQGVPSVGTAYHLGFAVRSTATDDITIDVTILYDANDGFFGWAPPPACGTLVIEPQSSGIVGVSGAETIVRQRGAEIPLHFDEAGGHELRVGRVVPGEETTVSCPPAGSVLVDWA
jgi:hypothetical protein